MTRTKICGITNCEDAAAAIEAGAAALGFVFADSPRRVTPAQARQIVRRLPPFVTTVGVFVDTPAYEITDTLAETGVQVAQLHGTESPADCAAVPYPVIKRFAVTNQTTPEMLAEQLAEYDVAAWLLDPGGGDGVPFDWARLRTLSCNRARLMIAGGLTPRNVADVIARMRPFAVDVSSGVESAPGTKAPAKIQDFLRAVEEADAACIAGY